MDEALKILVKLAVVGLSAVLLMTYAGAFDAPVPSEPVEPAMREPARDVPKVLSYEAERKRMVELQLKGRDITDPKVLEVMGRVPRHLFLPDELQHRAHEDRPLPILHRQTISQPYIVAIMSQIGMTSKAKRALDIGTGSGYQAAVLGELVEQVYSIEIVCELADSARAKLTEFGYQNIEVRCGDGYRGWPEHAPFDVIIVAAAPDHVPEPLIEQLAPGGKLVIPVGDVYQDLMVITRTESGTLEKELIFPVRFVPMTGEAKQ